MIFYRQRPNMATEKYRMSKRGAILMKTSRLFFFLTSFALLTPTGACFATDYKVYSGAECQPTYGNEAHYFTFDPGGITNDGPVPSFVTCPLVRDRIPSPGALDPGMRVISANGATLTCEFLSMDQNGKVLHSVTKSTSANVPTPLIFSRNGPIRTEAAGSYVFECWLPEKGRVINYSLGEVGETGTAELP